MKKSLSLLLAIVMVFGLFASMASAADLTTAEKYQEFVNKGILKGTTAGGAQLDSKLTRAQYATIAVAFAGLPVATEGQTFTDVTKGQWWYGAIEAAAKAGLVEGTGNNKFTPRADVTVESVIKVAVALADVKPVEGAKIEGASDWAGPYIQAAIDAGLTSARTDYKQAATRGQTIDIMYEVYSASQAPAKVSVVSAKATGVAKVTVTLDKAVDTSKATLTLKRGTSTVGTDVVWSDDKKSATLTLKDTKIAEADYTVTLGGLASDEIGTASASFKGEKETVAKLEFVSAGNEIAYTTAARVKLRAENQYGELASFNAASFNVVADASMNPSLTKDSEGYLVVRLNTTTLTNATQGLSMIPIYVYFVDNHLTASKTFKLGFAPFVTKAELSEVKYDNGKTALINTGDTATADLRLYDQYGNPIAFSQALSLQFNHTISPYSQALPLPGAITVDDFDSDDEYEVRVALSNKVDKAAKHTLTTYVGSASAQTTFDVGTSKVATKIEFESYDKTLATGDAGKYVTFNAYDANGDKLTPQEIVDNVKATPTRFTLTASGVSGANIVTVGPNKGKIALPLVTSPARGYVFLSLSILSPNANDAKTLQIPVAEARVPSSVVVEDKPHVKAVMGATSDFAFQVKDQYGEDFATDDADYRVRFDYVNGSGNGGSAATSGITVTGGHTLAGNGSSVAQTVYESSLAAVNAVHTFETTAGVFGRATLKATLEENDGGWKDISNTVAVSIESIDPANVALNYSLADISSLYATIDNDSLFPGMTDFFTAPTVKEITLAVKDNAGNTVAYPANIKDVTTSNNLIAQVKQASNQAFVVGNNAGEATVTAVVYKANGETATLTSKVNVKADQVVASKLTAEESVNLLTATTGSAAVLMDLVLEDNYGIEHDNVAILGFDKLFGVRFTVSEINGAAVTVNSTSGAFTVTPIDTKYQFVITATAPNGQSVSTVFHNN